MIVPQTKLIGWFASLALPLALLGALMPALWPLLALLIGLFLLLLLTDAWRSWDRLKPIGISLPPLSHLTQNRAGQLWLTLQLGREAGSWPKTGRLALAFPAEIEPTAESILVEFAAKTGESRLAWDCTPRRRGNYRIEQLALETSSHWGFWAIRRRDRTNAEIRVYPDLRAEQKHLAALFLRRGALGNHAQRQVGKGRDFEKLREYCPGDSYEDIHWRATAKRGYPVTKLFQIEKTQEVYLLLDTSRLSGRTVANDGGYLRQIDRFVTTALIFALLAEKQGDLFGLLTFDDQVRHFIRARSGKGHYSGCRDQLYNLEPSPVNPDFAGLSAFIRHKLRRRALLILLTNLDDPLLAEMFVANIDLIARQHLCLVNVLTLPGMAPLFSPAEIQSEDDIYAALGGHWQWQNMRELGNILRRRGVGLNLVNQAALAPELVSQYLNVKRRQLL
jgi:uncharacterized protein (DUF58 family)